MAHGPWRRSDEDIMKPQMYPAGMAAKLRAFWRTYHNPTKVKNIAG
jgi:hypothetical protein